MSHFLVHRKPVRAARGRESSIFYVGPSVSTGSRCSGRPTLRTASEKRDGLPRSELKKIEVALVAMAAMAQTAYMRPVAATGMSTPLLRGGA